MHIFAATTPEITPTPLPGGLTPFAFHINMFKPLLASLCAVTCCLGNPVQARNIGDVFDGNATQLVGGCYETTGGPGVCWQKLNRANTFSLSLRARDTSPGYATTVYLECGGNWESYGPAAQANVSLLVSAFCEQL